MAGFWSRNAMQSDCAVRSVDRRSLKIGRYMPITMPPTMTPMNDHDQRFEQAGQRVDRVVDFLLVELGDLEQHGVERAGLFADRGHLHDHVREQVDLLHRHVDAGSRPTTSSRMSQHGLLVDDVAGGAGHDLQRLDQRHAGLEGHRQRAREARDRRVVHDLADDRQLQDHAVEKCWKRRRALLEHDEGDDRRRRRRPGSATSTRP